MAAMQFNKNIYFIVKKYTDDTKYLYRLTGKNSNRRQTGNNSKQGTSDFMRRMTRLLTQ